MTKIQLKRVYDDPEKTDGVRVFVDRLWPRGMKKGDVHYDIWAKEITPSPDLRKWFHVDPENRWNDFASTYGKELEHSDAAHQFVEAIKSYSVVTLLYASRNKEHNHAEVLKSFLEKELSKS